MSTNYEEYAQFQVIGANLRNIPAAFGNFSLIASSIMIDEGLGTPDTEGMAQVDPDRWYSLPANLRAFRRMREEFGDYVIQQAGTVVPKFAVLPPHITTIHQVLEGLDIVYHLNHGSGGKALFSPETGEMRDGIGHYRCMPIAGKKQIDFEVDTPYLCIFEQKLILAMAQRFEPSATLVHNTPSRCRSSGARSCSYSVTWR